MSTVAVMEKKTPQLSLDGLNDIIVNLFECPVCFNYMVPPVFQCKNAHNVCSQCKLKLTKCPCCNEVLLDSRNVFVERIAEQLQYPCMNLEGGCFEKHPAHDILKHHKVCPYRMYECLPGKADNCRWMGRNCDILTHTRETHADKCWMVGSNHVEYPFNVFDGCEETQLMTTGDQIFWYNFKCDVVKQKMFLAVQYIGPKEQACNFTYQFQLWAVGDEETSITLKKRTCPDTEEVSTIFESGSCVALDFAVLRQYIGSSDSMDFCLRVERIVR
jgi:hypothetical protein